MNNQQAMIELIKATSGQANILTIPRPYIEFMGSLDGGLFLSQLIYWSDRGGQDDGWFYKSYLEWEAETTLSKYEVGKQANILKEKGILTTKVVYLVYPHLKNMFGSKNNSSNLTLIPSLYNDHYGIYLQYRFN